MDIIKNMDTVIFYFFNKTCHVDVFDNIAIFITNLGDGSFVFMVAVCFLLFKKKSIRLSGVLLLAGLTISYYLVTALKDLMVRSRPFLVLPDVNVLVKANDFSFPSGHTSIAFMAAFLLTKCFGRWYIFYPVALLVAASRVYLGVHFPSDVIVGALIGTIIGYILVRTGKIENEGTK